MTSQVSYIGLRPHSPMNPTEGTRILRADVLELPELLDPSGQVLVYDWGYRGYNPTNLAYAVLQDVLGDLIRETDMYTSRIVEAFMMKVIAAMPMNGFELPESLVWLSLRKIYMESAALESVERQALGRILSCGTRYWDVEG